MNSIRYKFAYNSSSLLVSISDVTENNRKEQYYCPSCGKILRPRLGSRRTHHFYHYHLLDNDSCGLETYLHNVSKNILFSKLTFLKENDESYYVNIYNLTNSVDKTGNIVLQKKGDLYSKYDILKSCNEISMEKYSGEYKPDILLNYTDKESLFLEIQVCHKSSLKKRSNNTVVEININDESDIDRIQQFLEEKVDEFFNFDRYRDVVTTEVEYPPAVISYEDVNNKNNGLTIVEKNKLLNSICNDFNNKRLYSSISYNINGIIGSTIRDTHTKIILSDFFHNIQLLTDQVPYCELTGSKNEKLIIGFDHEIKFIAGNKRFIILSENYLKGNTLSQDTIIESNLKLDLNKLDDSYLLTVSCFIPKGYFMSCFKEMKYRMLIQLMNQNEIELIKIEKIRKSLTTAST